MPGKHPLVRTRPVLSATARMAPPGAVCTAISPIHFLFAALLVVAFLVTAARAGAAPVAPDIMRPEDVRSGTLLFRGVQEGEFVRAPLVATDYDIAVSGPTARARVTQHFYNPTDGWVEGVYVFPLPDDAAVDTLKVVVGNRVIIGEIRERETAKRIYEQAKAEGKKAALLQQERPNVFTNSVANIGPRETVVVQIEYQQGLPLKDGEFSLRAPLVVAPRYNPEPLVQTVSFDGGWGRADAPASGDSPASAPVLDPATNPKVNPVTLTVRLQAGFPLGRVKSHHHKVRIRKVSADIRIVTLDGAVPADRDFELTWSAKASEMPTAGLFREKVNGEEYLLAFVTPPPAERKGANRPREMIFVIDTSGSMAGRSIEQARASLQFALDRLSPWDRFNIISFSSSHHVLFPAAVAADAAHLAQARRYVAGLSANGGTEMVPAMLAALADDAPEETDRLRQIVFITDGAIGHERQIFDVIAAGLGRSRIFMVGIGSAPNSWLMNHAAMLGRGSATHIGNADQVEERMRALFTRLETPAVTGLAVRFPLGGADVTPEALPDIYAGETLAIAAKLPAPRGEIEISGRAGDRPWTVKLPVREAAEGRGISKLWARAKITDVEAGARLGRIRQEEADGRILALALEHGLVSRLTSLVAVDAAPDRPADAPLRRADVPLNLPAGWKFEKVFGERGDGRVHRGEYRDAALHDASLTRIAAADRPVMAEAAAMQTGRGISLPATGTESLLHLRLGLLLLAAALLLLAAGRRRRAGA